VGAAEDGYTCHHRPGAAGTEPADAVDDAADVCLSHHAVPEWLGIILGGF